MPKVISQIKCNDCGDEFTATTSEDFTYCKCGKCGVKPEVYGTTYKRESSFKVLKSDVYYSDDDFIILDSESLDLWSKIKELEDEFKFPLAFYKYEWYKDSADGNKFLYHIEAELHSWKHQENNKVSICIDLQESYGNTIDDIKARLKGFYKILLKVKVGKLDLNNRKLLKRISTNWRKEQQELYDYTFEF